MRTGDTAGCLQDTGLSEAGYWTLECVMLDCRVQDTGLPDAGYWTLGSRILDYRMQDT
jgi:hypothetical protein